MLSHFWPEGGWCRAPATVLAFALSALVTSRSSIAILYLFFYNCTVRANAPRCRSALLLQLGARATPRADGCGALWGGLERLARGWWFGSAITASHSVRNQHVRRVTETRKQNKPSLRPHGTNLRNGTDEINRSPSGHRHIHLKCISRLNFAATVASWPGIPKTGWRGGGSGLSSLMD